MIKPSLLVAGFERADNRRWEKVVAFLSGAGRKEVGDLPEAAQRRPHSILAHFRLPRLLRSKARILIERSYDDTLGVVDAADCFLEYSA